jgi:hypothetical protein
MKRNNLTTMDDFKGEWSRAAKAREEFYAGKDPSRKADVINAVNKHWRG